MTKDGGLPWQYDEYSQVGTDYGEEAEAQTYDSRHADFRDAEAESAAILDALGVNEDHVLIDFGAGTGVLAAQASRRCRRVHAVDVSQAMLERARSRVLQAGMSNIEFHHAGFLTYEHRGTPADAIVTTYAFHHLPDFWKGIALKRLNGMMKPGARLYIQDVIITEGNALKNIQALIDRLGETGGRSLREDTERHFREEFSTYDWVMDGLLSRAGFSIDTRRIDDGVLGIYLCVKEQ